MVEMCHHCSSAKMALLLNNPLKLISHKTKKIQTKPNQFLFTRVIWGDFKRLFLTYNLPFYFFSLLISSFFLSFSEVNSPRYNLLLFMKSIISHFVTQMFFWAFPLFLFLSPSLFCSPSHPYTLIHYLSIYLSIYLIFSKQSSFLSFFLSLFHSLSLSLFLSLSHTHTHSDKDRHTQIHTIYQSIYLSIFCYFNSYLFF